VPLFFSYLIYCVRDADPSIETMILYRKNMLRETKKSGAEKWAPWVDALLPLWDWLLTFLCEDLLITFTGTAQLQFFS
jgi:hypothetical protein